jgi:ATP-dependent DNA helicase RecQ
MISLPQEHKVLFFDLQAEELNKPIEELGFCIGEKEVSTKTCTTLYEASKDAQWLCGHNIIHYDLILLYKHLLPPPPEFKALGKIDTLFLSLLLHPEQRYHALAKQGETALDDAIASRNLLRTLVLSWESLVEVKKQLWFQLLGEKPEFKGFFSYVGFEGLKIGSSEIINLIKSHFINSHCDGVNLVELIEKSPLELCYALSYLDVLKDEVYGIAPFIAHRYPKVGIILRQLRMPCGGKLCSSVFCTAQSPKLALKRWFQYDGFRVYGQDALQEEAVVSALRGESLLVIFPTGGGKSLTFQLPALMKHEHYGSLTVVISPLQALMKDQVDVLKRKDINKAVTINGLLSPLERQEAMERVANGQACLLYLAPESLRSESILQLLAHRMIDRLVIDEAHCLSSWGQDFRVDYLYIASEKEMGSVFLFLVLRPRLNPAW